MKSIKQKKIIVVKNFFILYLTILFLSSCAGSVSKKNETKNKYPSTHYLTAKGSGQTEPEARERAISRLSQIFESKVSTNTLSKIKSFTDAKGDETVKKSAVSSVNVISKIKLKGVQVVETWFNDNEGIYYALAVLNRYNAKKNWERERNYIDNIIEGDLKALKIEKTFFLQYKHLKGIINSWVKREVINSRLRVIGFSDTSLPDYEIKTIFTKLSEVKSKMLFFVKIDGENSEKVNNQIGEALTAAGMMIENNKENANIIIKGNIKTEPVKLNNPDWKFARATISLNLLDSNTGLTLGEITENKRASHITYKEAENKAIKNTSKKITHKLINFIEIK